MRKIFFLLMAFTLFCFSSIYPSGNSKSHPRSPTIRGDIARLNINKIDLQFQNDGSTGEDGHAYYPSGTTMSFLFQGGLAATGYVNGDLRGSWMAKASLIQEWQPGGWGMDPEDPLAKFYAVSFEDGPGSTAYIDWADAVARGAEFIDLNGDGIYDPYVDKPAFLGDKMFWTVYNDGTNMSVRNNGLQTPPLGLEIRQSVWAYRESGDLEDVIFFRFQLINVSNDNIDDFIFSLWADGDIGNAIDDLIGCDTTLSTGYIYNDGLDAVYGSNPPAFGIQFLQGGLVDSPGDTAFVYRGPLRGIDTLLNSKTLGMTAFTFYHNAGELDSFPTPRQNVQRARWYQEGGVNGHGVPIDPTLYGTGGTPTDPPQFFYSGDPVSATGWRDNVPRDKRFLVNCGPFHFAAGDTQDIVFTYTVGQGTDPLSSIAVLRQRASSTKLFFPYGRTLRILVNDTLLSVDSIYVFEPRLLSLLAIDTIQSVNWQLIDQPAGSNAQIIPGPGYQASLEPDLAGLYTVQAGVTIQGGVNIAANLTVEAVNNHPPAAILTIIPSEIVFGDSASADASASMDPDNDDLHFSWTFPQWVLATPQDIPALFFTPLHTGAGMVAVSVTDSIFYRQAEDSFTVTPLENGLEIINSLEGIDNVTDMKYKNGLLFLCNEFYRFLILNADNLDTLSLSFIPCQKFDTDGTYLVTATLADSVSIYEIDANYQLSLKSRINVDVFSYSSYLADIYLRFPYLFIPSDYPRELRVYDISNPVSPNLISSFPLPVLSRDISFNDNFAALYSRIPTIGIVTLNISDPSNIVALDTLNLPPFEYKIEYAGDKIYTGGVQGNANEINIIDASHPDNLQLTGSITIEPIVGGTTNEPIEKIFAEGDFLFVGTKDGVKIFDVSDISNPYERASFHSGFTVQSIAWNQPYLYGAFNSLESIPGYLHRLFYDSTFVPIETKDIPPAIPESYRLYQNYPNPFNPTTNIRYQLPKPSEVVLKIFNILGQEVRTVVYEKQSAGVKTVKWDGKNNSGQKVSTGIYIYRLQAGNKILSKKMLLLR